MIIPFCDLATAFDKSSIFLENLRTAAGYNAQKAESDMVYTFEFHPQVFANWHGVYKWGIPEISMNLVQLMSILHGVYLLMHRRYRPSGKDLPPQEIKLPPTFQTIIGTCCICFFRSSEVGNVS